MLQNQPITTPLFQTSLRSWRAKYVAQQQAAQAADQPETADAPQTTSEQPAQTGPQRVKRLAPRRRKRRQAAGTGA